MPLFFFNFSDNGVVEIDDIGCEFANVEAAFVDAYQGMVRIGADMLLEHKDPSALIVEILAETGEMLMSLTYAEVCRRDSQRRSSTKEVVRASHVVRQELRQQVEKSRLLAAEVQSAFLRVQATAEAVHTAVSFARFQSLSSPRRGS